MASIGIVIPVLDELKNLRLLLESLDRQTDPGPISAIFIAVGDADLADYQKLISEFPNISERTRVLRNEKKVTPVGLNIGTDECLKAGIDVIQFLGAHSRIKKDFIKKLSDHINENPDIDIFNSSLLFTVPETNKERGIQLFTYSRLGRNWKDFFNESKKGFITGIFAVRKRVFEFSGLFDEKFTKNQDIEFVKRALKKGYNARLFTDLVYYYKVRPGITATLKQMFTTGKFVALRLSRVNIKQLAPVLFYTTLVLILLLYMLIKSPVVFFVLTVIITFYLAVVLIESAIYLFKKERAAFFLPVIFISSHFVYAAGTFYGLLLKLKNR